MRIGDNLAYRNGFRKFDRVAMGSRGPLKQDRLHVVKGAADQGTRKDYRADEPPAYSPQAPDWRSILGRDKRAVADAEAEWELTVTELDRRGLLARTDASMVVDYVLCHARVLQLERRLSSKGFMLQTPKGPVKNPVTTTLNQYRGALQAHRVALGLSPAARKRLNVAAPEPGDDDDDLKRKPPV